jgi:hypothetical protein
MTNAVGIVSKAGRYGGGTFAHRNIAFEFASWLSPEFKYYLISEFERLKIDEQQQNSLEWNLQRTLSKINYRIHTDAIKDEIIPKTVSKEQIMFVYANEADLLNVDCQAMAGRKPERKGQYSRLCHIGTTCSIVEYGKHKRFTHSTETSTIRATCTT